MLRAHALRAACVLAATGALSRFTFRHVETRWQIVAFWGIAALYQFVGRPALGRRGSWVELALDAGLTAVAIVAVKVAIEGKL